MKRNPDSERIAAQALVPELTLGAPPALPEPLARALPLENLVEKRQHVRLVNKFRHGSFHLERDVLAQEEDLDVLVEGEEGYVLSRTPGDDRNLVLGSLFTRGRITAAEECRQVGFKTRLGRDQAMVLLIPSAERPGVQLLPLQDTRRERLRMANLFEFSEIFESLQVIRKQTGATHGAALFDAGGVNLSFGEDVGRHNALDKAIGSALESGCLTRCSVAMLSSRLAQELVLKAVACSIPILAGFSVATAAAVECAQCYGITLIGRIRTDSLNVYSHSWRIV